MAGETTLTICGNLVDDPELRFTPSGAAVAKFRVASTPRTFDKQAQEWRDSDPLFISVAAWRQLGENCAESLRRGMRVIVQGQLKQRSYEDREGVKRVVYEITAEEVGPSLRNAAAAVTKATSNTHQQQERPTGNAWGQQTSGSDPWATQGSAEPPF
jgi:single-strand DNA-binding protein